MLLARPRTAASRISPASSCSSPDSLIALASLGTLGRSFGIVAANRGVKTRGPYRLVRHPAYFGYLMSYLGYVAENPSFREPRDWLCLSTAFQLVRIREERAAPAVVTFRSERLSLGLVRYQAHSARLLIDL